MLGAKKKVGDDDQVKVFVRQVAAARALDIAVHHLHVCQTLLQCKVFEPRELSYLDAWKRLFKKEHRPRLLCFMGFGEELIAQAVRPVFIFVMVREFFNVGAIVSAATMATAVMAVAIGRLTDTRGRHRMLGVGTFFTALSWFVRPAVAIFGSARSMGEGVPRGGGAGQ